MFIDIIYDFSDKLAVNVSLAELVAARAAELLPQDNDFAK